MGREESRLTHSATVAFQSQRHCNANAYPPSSLRTIIFASNINTAWMEVVFPLYSAFADAEALELRDRFDIHSVHYG